MKSLKYLLTGLFFGIVMIKSEAVSWYRIQEMFRFQSFHMYGIIGTAVVIGLVSVWLVQRFRMNDTSGKPIMIVAKNRSFWKYMLGGILFGLGWALTGACPGPLFVLLGYGYLSIAIVIASAIAGTFLYCLVKNRLPH